MLKGTLSIIKILFQVCLAILLTQLIPSLVMFRSNTGAPIPQILHVVKGRNDQILILGEN